MSPNGIQDDLRESLERKLSCYLGTSPEDATKKQMYKAVILCVKDILMQKRSEFKEQVKRSHLLETEDLEDLQLALWIR